MSERVIVTGAAGFIGGHACRALLGAGYGVIGFDNFDPFYDRKAKESAVADLSASATFSFVEGDVRDSEALDHVCRGASVIVHLAARAGVRPSIQDPVFYASTNVEGTVSVLEASRRAGIRRIVFGSSSSVYGNSSAVPFCETAPAVDPISPYAATKRAGELIASVYTGLHGFRVAALRFFTAYGPRQRPDLAIHRFTKLLLDGRTVPQYGDGSSERDYTHVDDVVRGVVGAIKWTQAPDAAFEIFNLGESRMVRLDYLIDLIATAAGVPAAVETLPEQPGDVRRTCADIQKARRVLGYDPQVAIEDGIPKFVRWYREAYGRQS